MQQVSYSFPKRRSRIVTQRVWKCIQLGNSRKTVRQFGGCNAGWSWLSGFILRHPDFSVWSPEPLGFGRLIRFSEGGMCDIGSDYDSEQKLRTIHLYYSLYNLLIINYFPLISCTSSFLTIGHFLKIALVMSHTDTITRHFATLHSSLIFGTK